MHPNIVNRNKRDAATLSAEQMSDRGDYASESKPIIDSGKFKKRISILMKAPREQALVEIPLESERTIEQ